MKNQSAIRDPRSKIVVVGGGPAGSSAAVRLARAGFRVNVIDKDKFPRPKLCGEFISPECLRHFAGLGVLEEMIADGGESVLETMFYDRRGRSIAVPSEWFGGSGTALSLSRSRMDDHLLQAAKREGVRILEEATATRATVCDGKLASIAIRSSEGDTVTIEADVFIDATGRSAIVSKLLSRSAAGPARRISKPQYVAFKAHLTAPNADRGRCEIYSFGGGYGGLSPVEGGLANLCFVVDSELARSYGGDAEHIMRKVVCANPHAAGSLRDADTASEWLAVAIQHFGRNAVTPAANVFSIGDAASFIDPFTGSGILMALESSEILADSLSDPRSDLARAVRDYRDRYKARFAARLRVCSILRYAAFHPRLATAAISLLGVSRTAREFLAKRTRGEYISEN